MKNTDLANIMKTAWAVVKSEKITISNALKLAWRAYKLKIKMRTENVKFAFRKIDGTIREAIGTMRNIEFVDYTGCSRAKNYTVQTYFDVEKGAFRSFKVSGLILV